MPMSYIIRENLETFQILYFAVRNSERLENSLPLRMGKTPFYRLKVLFSS
jgi:hypothetical protein